MDSIVPATKLQAKSVLDRALELAAQGWPVFPCRAVAKGVKGQPGYRSAKAPLVRGWQKVASTDPAAIRAMPWGGDTLIGVPTGPKSANGCGFDVLDLDPRNGSKPWKDANIKGLPLTRTHFTKSEGMHLFFIHEPGLGNSVEVLHPGVDVKAAGGYVIWWPGFGGEAIADDDLIVPWPRWLLNDLAEKGAGARSGAKASPLTDKQKADMVPPYGQAAAVVELLNQLPNPISAHRGVYTRLMYAAVGCSKLADDPADDIRAAAADWAERWEGWDAQDEREKWDSDWSRVDTHSGWKQLVKLAKELIPGFVDKHAGWELKALANAEADPAAAAPVQLKLVEITEDHAARRFAAENAARFKYDHSEKAWLAFADGTGWQRDPKGGVIDAVRRFLYSAREEWGLQTKEAMKAASIGFVSAVVRGCESDPLMATTAEEWDTDPMLLGVSGGYVDLRTGETHTAATGHLIRRRTSVAPADGPAPVWNRFLAEATGGDAEMQGWLQRLVGYALTGDVSEEIVAFVYGPGRNGKGVFLHTISSILGAYAYQAPPELFKADSRTNKEYQTAKLDGVRLLLVSETEAGSALAESFVKELTGNEGKINARHPYGRPFEFRSRAKVLIVGNHAPKLNGRSEAMERRLRVAPFNQTPAEPDPTLKDRLVAEYPAILAWAIRGCLDWQAHRLGVCGAVRGASASYFEEQDLVAQWLAERCDMSDPAARTASSALLEDLNGWLRGRGESHMTARDFKEMIASRHPRLQYRHVKTGSVFEGVRLEDRRALPPLD